ncbi:hypothetical protein HHL17_11130 [Chitinophaga sp. G-6-1-13]|uniref:Uncharacterized protein n=1 Tax=Chitinophaga fulva TaxID=2728842 RepID=A0A848GIS1_9BACT|nr:hypothetical protein [Chitinophaga fulva]NML37747.1 hypothetical protein [Chitinophaga fulva]
MDAEKLSNLEIIQDGKEHASIKPTDDYLKRNNMSMGEALDDWNAKGDSHPLSVALSKVANYK